ncbi:MAG: hypothetical protein ABI347_01625 [Nitrososphaera sp.]|jgi:hypothetical protein
MSGDDFEEDVDFELSSDRAKQVSDIIKAALYNTAESFEKINFLVFGPSKDTPEFKTHRLPIKEMIRNKKRQNADFPEDIDEKVLKKVADPKDPGYLKKILENPATKEIILARGYDFIVIPLISVGTFSEFSLFVKDTRIAPKIRLYIPKEFARSKGFLTKGPVEVFRRAYDNVKSFKDSKDLLKKVCDTVDDLITMRLLQS